MSASKKSAKKQTKTKAKRTTKSSGRTKAKVTRGKAQAKPAKKKAKKVVAKKRAPAPAAPTQRRKSQKRNQASARPTVKGDSGAESGDLQGLGTIAEADSESASELLEEGNAFEAGVVGGVEEAGDEPEREVHTRQVREDDVPEEYLETDET